MKSVLCTLFPVYQYTFIYHIIVIFSRWHLRNLPTNYRILTTLLLTFITPGIQDRLNNLRSSSTLPLSQPESCPPTPTRVSGASTVVYENEERGDLIKFYNSVSSIHSEPNLHCVEGTYFLCQVVTKHFYFIFMIFWKRVPWYWLSVNKEKAEHLSEGLSLSE